MIYFCAWISVLRLKKKVWRALTIYSYCPNMNYYSAALRVTCCIFLYSSPVIQISDSQQMWLKWRDYTAPAAACTSHCLPFPTRLLGAALGNQAGGKVCCPSVLDLVRASLKDQLRANNLILKKSMFHVQKSGNTYLCNTVLEIKIKRKKVNLTKNWGKKHTFYSTDSLQYIRILSYTALLGFTLCFMQMPACEAGKGS